MGKPYSLIGLTINQSEVELQTYRIMLIDSLYGYIEEERYVSVFFSVSAVSVSVIIH